MAPTKWKIQIVADFKNVIKETDLQYLLKGKTDTGR